MAEPAYVAYLVLAAVLVIGVGWTLFRNGAVFLRGVFPEDDRLAAALNRLLLTGFYLVNIGFVLLTSTLGDPAEAFRTVTVKLGMVAVTLGLLHFVNLSMLNNARRRRILAR